MLCRGEEILISFTEHVNDKKNKKTVFMRNVRETVTLYMHLWDMRMGMRSWKIIIVKPE